MKSYFMDEVWSLKQEAPITKQRDYKQDKTTALKSRMKLLELKNQLLKDVSNKFIDAVLEHHSKLGHNIDVTPASPTTYHHHVASEAQYIGGKPKWWERRYWT